MSKRMFVPWTSILGALQVLGADQTTNAVPATAQTSTPIQDKIINYVIDHSGAIIGAVIIVVIGIVVARWIGMFVMRWLAKREMEPPVRMLISRLSRLLVIGLAAVMALGTVGANIAALIAGIGVAGVGVGLAMQGVLSNLVAGLTIIFTKPFRVGEYIELLGVQGQVDTIEMFSTTLKHPDRSRVVIPNRKIVGEVLHNYGTIRQLDLTVGVAYGTDLNEAIRIVRSVFDQNPRVLKDPTPIVGVTTLANSSINIAARPWVNVPDYGPAMAELYQTIVERFRDGKVEIPFPQREVRMLKD
jgi:small conductance mechanosensitive channel